MLLILSPSTVSYFGISNAFLVLSLHSIDSQAKCKTKELYSCQIYNFKPFNAKRPKMARHILKIFLQIPQDNQDVSDYFGTLCIKGLKYFF